MKITEKKYRDFRKIHFLPIFFEEVQKWYFGQNKGKWELFAPLTGLRIAFLDPIQPVGRVESLQQATLWVN